MHLAPLEPSTPSSKVAIPRATPQRSFGNGRVKRACIECREQKTKCNGHQPCGRCTDFGMECVYVDGKREAMQKRLQELEKQAQAYDRLLTEIQPRLDSHDKELISRTRAQVRTQHLLTFCQALLTIALALVFQSRFRACKSRPREPRLSARPNPLFWHRIHPGGFPQRQSVAGDWVHGWSIGDVVD
jgi:hypothetical protein